MYLEELRMQCRALFSNRISTESHEVNNYCNDNFDPDSEQIGEFRDSAKRVEEFMRTVLCPHGLEHRNSFYYAILYAIHYQLKNKKDERQNEDQLKEDVGRNL